MWVYTSDILGNETLEFDGVWKRISNKMISGSRNFRAVMWNKSKKSSDEKTIGEPFAHVVFSCWMLTDASKRSIPCQFHSKSELTSANNPKQI